MTALLQPPVAGVIGWPIAQSKSPLIHRFWLETLGMDGDYSRFPVPPDQVEAALRGVSALGLRGVNVTAPLKLAVMAHLDRVDAVAAAIGAVNTICRDADGGLYGTNTDARGFMEPLSDKAVRGRPAAVLGAGGAARAVLAGLCGAGVGPVHIFARDAAAAARLLDAAGVDGRIHPFGAPLPGECALVVNATSLGMVGKPALAIDLGPLARDCIVYDLVYAPLETALLAQARARGLPTIDGLSMLIGQADQAFRLFFDAPPPRGRDAQLRCLLQA
jgi:shikimate dehydrogenase